jgi:hypothetical protein
LLEVLPPPTCTLPTEFDAVLSPESAIEVGAEAAAEASASLRPADGETLTFPVWTAPTEPVASFSASAVCALPSATATSVAVTSNNLDLMAVSFFWKRRVTRPTGVFLPLFNGDKPDSQGIPRLSDSRESAASKRERIGPPD